MPVQALVGQLSIASVYTWPQSVYMLAESSRMAANVHAESYAADLRGSSVLDSVACLSAGNDVLLPSFIFNSNRFSGRVTYAVDSLCL